MLSGSRVPYLRAAVVVAGSVIGLWFAAFDAHAATRSAVVVGVSDGDTAIVRIDGRARRVHLEGLRTYGARTCLGQRARRTLARLLPRGRRVKLQTRTRTFPRSRTITARVYVGRRRAAATVGRVQVLRGWARTRTTPRTRATYFAAYRRAERAARARSRGAWARPCTPRVDTGVDPGTPTTPTDPVPTTPPPPNGVGLATVTAGFDRPISVSGRPGGSDIVIAEQGGLVRIVRDGAILPAAMLDLTGVVNQSGGEVGLLGIAFHPQHAMNGLFYVHYVDPGMTSRVVEYQVNPGGDTASSRPPREIIAQQQPGGNHNGGQLAFGSDGNLYIALGDGGAGGAASQNRGNLLGSILRINVDVPAGGLQYSIPADNPFVGQAGVRGEIWAFGLRNPWRFSVDRLTGDLWIGDVGENAIEEIDHLAAGAGGANFGWNAFEGTNAFSGSLSSGVHVPPVAEYTHQNTGGCSITGGSVYRGAEVPGLSGRYVYGDYCTGDVWSISATNPAEHPTDLDTNFAPELNLLWSFGERADGELYFTAGDTLYRFIAVDPA